MSFQQQEKNKTLHGQSSRRQLQKGKPTLFLLEKKPGSFLLLKR